MKAIFIRLLILIPFISSCNKEFPNRLLEYSEQQGYDAGTSKVLYIIVDGLRGEAVQEILPTQLVKMQQNSMFGYGSLIDFKSNPHTKEIGWTNLLSGTTSDKHAVVNSDLSTYKSKEYPNLLSRIKALDLGYEITANSSSDEFTNTFIKGVTDASVSKSDQEVVDKTKAALKENERSVFLAHFSEVDKAGQAGSYESSDAKYIAAIKAFDKQVSELITEIQSRQNFKTENWLVIVTSSAGGAIENNGEINNTSYGDSKRNIFTLFYSPKFDRKFFPTPNSSSIPYQGAAVRYTYGTPSTNAVLQDAAAFNFANNKNFTISFNFKSNIKDGNWNYPIFLSKRDAGFSGPGWNIFGEVRNGNMALGMNSNIGGQAFGTAVNNGEWHNFTVTVTRGDSLRVFTDGVPNDRQALTNGNNLDNNAPLVVGKKAGNDNSAPDVLISNIQIYNVAIPKENIKAVYGKTLIDDSHPYYENLIGYWPGYDDIGKGQIRDMTGNGRHLNLTGNYNWVSFNDIVSYFSPPISDSFYKIVPNGVDVPFMIYQWLGIIPQKEWKLDGKSWTPVYKIMK
ncbi:LamG-like jellyroll fold domain-containing protein [Sphingobacterium cellulitidis]|uniref:LamG-like jellyroll fold domain-containing protein n=1 Tax=Sphingobacterium cellulitidis TaxID=1768011 RepID=UPI0026CFDC87